MFDKLWNDYIKNDDIKKAVYFLKGKYNNLDVLPIEDFGSDIFALTIGKKRESTLLASSLTEPSDIFAWTLLTFADELLSAMELSSSICKFSPSKILQSRSITIIPNLFNSSITQSERVDVLCDLCKEWDIKRLYLFENGENHNELFVTNSPKAPSHLRIMSELLASSSNYTLKPSDDTQPEFSTVSTELCEKPCFMLRNSDTKTPISEISIKNRYQKLQEFLMLTLMV